MNTTETITKPDPVFTIIENSIHDRFYNLKFSIDSIKGSILSRNFKITKNATDRLINEANELKALLNEMVTYKESHP
jgi:hypothetical protein